MAHTPGPWKLHRYPGHVEAENGLGCCDHEAIIVNTLGHSCNAEGLQEEQEDNARLIAAAPDLLEALRGLVEMEFESDHDGSDEDCNLCVAFVAITKAV